MKYSREAVLRHEAFKHGFEGHRKLKLAREEQRNSRPTGTFDTSCPPPYHDNYTKVFEDAGLTVYQMWMAGAHSGMVNSNASYWSEGRSNPEPLYDERRKQKQLQLF